MSSYNEYQKEAFEFARYRTVFYPFMALGEECGEAQALIAKSMRKHGNLSGVDKYKFAKELGDVLWNVAACATEMGLSLADIAEDNLDKLKERRANGTIVER